LARRILGRPRDPDRIIRRAYQDLLGRDPDAEGLRHYRSRIIDDGWSEAQVREAVRESSEYREKNTMTREKAEEIVRRAYLSVLNREPDAASQSYTQVLRNRWTQQDVERELRESPEYRNRHR
jgi:TorA maturation chaperone TorD